MTDIDSIRKKHEAHKLLRKELPMSDLSLTISDVDRLFAELDEARGKIEAARKWIRGARWVELEEIIFGKEGA